MTDEVSTWPVWPAELPYKPQREGFQVTQLANTVLASDMNAGNARRRRRTTLEYEIQSVTLRMDAKAYRRFVEFYRDTLANGASLFYMQVWEIDCYVRRLVIVSEPPTVATTIVDQKIGYLVSMAISLQVEYLRDG